MNLQIGSTIGDYQIVGILGAGGMGKVYKVRNVISDRLEAMKVLLPDLVAQAELADRFLREIKVQASLEHPNIASLHTAVRVENQLLMLMEFVDGMTLEQRLKDGPLPVSEAVDYIAQVLSALEFAHQHGVIHRDIKPANMMLTPGGVVKLMDFGIAKASTDQRLTMTGTTMGSLYYMSPEQIQGASNIDARADLYSVGVSLYELTTGKRPFDGDSQFAIMSAHLEKTPIPPVAIDPKLPQALNDAILMSVAKDPAARFQTAGAFCNALGNVAPAARPAAVPQAITQPVPGPAPIPVAATVAMPQKPRSKRGLWMAAGALATAAAVIAAIEFGPWKETKAAPQTAQQQRQTQTPPVTAPAPQPTSQQTVEQQQPQTAPSPTKRTTVASHPQPALLQPPQVQTQTAAQQSNPQQPVQQPVQQPAQQPAQQATVQPQAQAAAPPPGPSRAEMQAAREQMMQLGVRVTGIKGSLQSLQRSMGNMNLNSKFTEPAGLMDGYMKGATDALNDHDVDSAKSFMEKAERQVVILEKLLNR
jgi:eukaryotic-like serine/threonine-protein kinase